MISKSSSEWKVVDDTLYILPSVITDIIFSYARERAWYLFNKFNKCEGLNTYLKSIIGATSMYKIKEGLNYAPSNYYEYFMVNISLRRSGFFVRTKQQIMCYNDRVFYDFICEVYIPDDAITQSFNERDHSNEEYDGFITNKMICCKRYKANKKNTYDTLDLRSA